MGKASMRRKSWRREYLRRLVVESPEKAWTFWAKRVQSYLREANYRAHHLEDRHGCVVGVTHGVITEALEELAAAGPEVIELLGKATHQALSAGCGRAVSAAYDPHLYRISNAQSNQQLIKLGTHRPRR